MTLLLILIISSCMPRPIRVEFPDAFYWISNVTNAGIPTFKNGRLAEIFIQTLEECVNRFQLCLYAYSISPKGYSLFLQSPQNNLTESIGWLQTTSTIRINRHNQAPGHVFSGRYKSILVSPEIYAKKVITYIHLEPFLQTSQLVLSSDAEERLASYPYSSHRSYCRGQERLEYVHFDFLLDFTDINHSTQNDYESIVRNWVQEGKIPDLRSEIRASLVLGSDELLCRVRDQISQKSGVMESKWLRTNESQQKATQIARLIPEDLDRDVKIWLRAKVGGERPSDLAREFEFSDTSGITHLLKKLDRIQKQDESFATEIALLSKDLTSEFFPSKDSPTASIKHKKNDNQDRSPNKSQMIAISTVTPLIEKKSEEEELPTALL